MTFVARAVRSAQDSFDAPVVRLLHRDRTVMIALIVLLIVDAVFIGIHTWRGVMKEGGAELGIFADPRFSLLKDQGFSEIFGYLKISLVAMLIWIVWLRRQQPIYFALALVFAAVLIDDMMQVHETGGHVLLAWVGRDTPLGIHVRDLGEILTWVLLGTAAVAGLTYAWRHTQADDRRVGAWFIACLVLLAAFGIGVDLLHSLAPTRRLDGLFGIVEDGGEMIVLSLTVAITLLVFRHSRDRVIVPRFRPA